MPCLEREISGEVSTGAQHRMPAEDPQAVDENEIAALPAVRLNGAEEIGRVIVVDQAALGRTPRSNPSGLHWGFR